MTYSTKDSGKRVEYPTGALRDTNEGKPRYDLIAHEALDRLAALMARGAEKYGDNNWKRGIPTERFYESAFRHLMQWRSGDESEDHLAAVLFNISGIMYNQEHPELFMQDGEPELEGTDGRMRYTMNVPKSAICQCGIGRAYSPGLCPKCLRPRTAPLPDK